MNPWAAGQAIGPSSAPSTANVANVRMLSVALSARILTIANAHNAGINTDMSRMSQPPFAIRMNFEPMSAPRTLRINPTKEDDMLRPGMTASIKNSP